MAYDAGNGATVLFGGFSSNDPCVLGDTWIWDGTTWSQHSYKPGEPRPSPRYGHAMTYDTARRQVVLFGGYDGYSDRGDTWTWDGSGWTEHKVVGPAPRARTAMAYDVDRGWSLLFGGDHAGSVLGDSWKWDGHAWTPIAPALSATAQGYHSMAYLAPTREIILFGGWNGHGLGETWRWDGTSWSIEAKGFGPGHRHSGSMAYHAGTGQVVYQPGPEGELGGPYREGAHSYGWDGTGVWKYSQYQAGLCVHTGVCTPPYGAPGRAFAAMAEDRSGHLVLFGGYGPSGQPSGPGDSADRADTWIFLTPGLGTVDPSAAGAAPDERLTLKVAPTAIPAGRSPPAAATATATVTRAGVPLSGQEVHFSTDGDVTFSPVSDHGDGTYTTTITASSTPDIETITARTSSPSVEANGVVVARGSASDSAALVEQGLALELDPPAVRADGVSTSRATATLFVDDSMDRQIVRFTTDGDALLSPVTKTGERTWSATITASRTPGLETITATSDPSGLSASRILDEGSTHYWIDRTVEAGRPAPLSRDQAESAYDGTRNVTVLFGGLKGTEVVDDTWTWDGSRWTERHPESSPPARFGHAMAYDEARGQVVLFGGNAAAAGTDVYLGDTWTWDGASWTKHQVAGPSPRAWSAMTYDAARQEIVLFAGSDNTQGDDTPDAVPLADTWTWNGAEWTQRNPSISPPGRGYAAFAYHPPTGKVVLHGGSQRYHLLFLNGRLSDPVGVQFNPKNDTWTWDGNTWAREGQGATPGPVMGDAMEYHARTGQLVLFDGERRRTWTWDASGWTKLAIAPELSPTRRQNFTTANDPLGRLLLFAGSVASHDDEQEDVYLGDTWTWDTALRMHLAPSAVPADGASTAKVTVTAANASGKPLSGLNVDLATDGDVSFSQVVDHGDGSYSATITASATEGTETITARTTAGFASATLYEVALPCVPPPVLSPARTWTEVASIPTARHGLLAAPGRDGRIYAFGGMGLHTDPLDVVEAYNPCTDRWESLPPMPGGARAMGAAATGPDGRIYLVGGAWTGGGVGLLDSVEVFTPGVGSSPPRWDTLPPMPAARRFHGATMGRDGRLYVLGGENRSSECLSTVDVYTQGRAGAPGMWGSVADMPAPLSGLAATTAPDGRILAVGGDLKCEYEAKTPTVQGYAMDTDGSGKWEPLPPMADPRHYFGAAAASERLVLATGSAGIPVSGLAPAGSPLGSFGGHSREVEAYAACDVWIPVASMSIPRGNHSAVTGPDKRVYVVGGLTSDDGVGDTSTSRETNVVEAYTPDPSLDPCSRGEIDDISVQEERTGTKLARFTVTLDRSPDKLLAIDYTTKDRTATAGTDYVATSGTLLFLPTDTSKTVDVIVNGDTAVEGKETFAVELTVVTPTAATLPKAVGTAAILDADASTAPPATPELSIGDVIVAETFSETVPAVVTVTISHKALGPVRVSYATTDGSATAGVDYLGSSGTVDIAAGETKAKITVPVLGDTVAEGTEEFMVSLSNPWGATLGEAVGRVIVDDAGGGALPAPGDDLGPTEAGNDQGEFKSGERPDPPVEAIAPVAPIVARVILGPISPPTQESLSAPAPARAPPPAASRPLTQPPTQVQAQQQSQQHAQAQQQTQTQAQAQAQAQASAQAGMMSERQREHEAEQAHAATRDASAQTYMASARHRRPPAPVPVMAMLASLIAAGSALAFENRNSSRGAQFVRQYPAGRSTSRRRRTP